MSIVSSPNSSQVSEGTEVANAADSVVFSLAFWACLLSSAALYGLVVLAPKVVRWSNRADEFAANQQQLHFLRQQIEQGERLAEIWESEELLPAVSDPVPAADRSNGDIVALDDELRFQGLQQEPGSVAPRSSESVGIRALEFVAGSRLLKLGGLAGSAALLIAAFTLLGYASPPPAPHQRAGTRQPAPRTPILLPNRYVLTDSAGRGSAHPQSFSSRPDRGNGVGAYNSHTDL